MTESTLEMLVPPAQQRIAELIYGSNLPILCGSQIEYVPDDQEYRCEFPKIIRNGGDPHLLISDKGAERWNEKLDTPCDVVGIEPVELYITSGLALLEITNAAKASLDGDMDARDRVVKAYKAIGNSEQVEKMAAQIGEQTEVSVRDILTAFDFEELLQLNHLRYGIGMALRSFGLKPKDVKGFQDSARLEAVKSLNHYFEGAATYLLCQAMDRVDATVRISEAIRLEPPILQLASSSPMNVTYLLDK